MARNTTKKNKEDGTIEEKGQPRCKRCYSRMTHLEQDGNTKLWCYNCNAPLMGQK